MSFLRLEAVSAACALCLEALEGNLWGWERARLPLSTSCGILCMLWSPQGLPRVDCDGAFLKESTVPPEILKAVSTVHSQPHFSIYINVRGLLHGKGNEKNFVWESGAVMVYPMWTPVQVLLVPLLI